MADLPSWLYPTLIPATILGQVVQVIGCGSEIVSVSGNAFELIARFATYNCPGTPPILSFVFFMLLTFSWVIFVLAFFSSTTTTGAIATLIAGVVALVTFLT